jgi:hypothetical protein
LHHTVEEGGTVANPPVLLAVLGSRAEADLMVGLLVSNGLRAAVATDDAGGQEPQLQLQGGARVLVAADDADEARQLLAAVEDG